MIRHYPIINYEELTTNAVLNLLPYPLVGLLVYLIVISIYVEFVLKDIVDVGLVGEGHVLCDQDRFSTFKHDLYILTILGFINRGDLHLVIVFAFVFEVGTETIPYL